MIRIVPFEEIDKNKWNGTVHYSPNGNVYGYHWYLKSVIREWDAIIENDYQTVLPIIKNPIKQSDYSLLSALGPYTINVMGKSWLKDIIELLASKNRSSFYPLNEKILEDWVDPNIQEKNIKSELDLIDNYDSLNSGYAIDIDHITMQRRENIKVGSGLKPEMMISLLNSTEHHKNTLLRIMYNAIHRGLGFSSFIENKEGKKVAASFFITSHNKITEICSFTINENYRYILLDLAIRNSAGKPSSLVTHQYTEIERKLGFKKMESVIIQVKDDFLLPIKKYLNLNY